MIPNRPKPPAMPQEILSETSNTFRMRVSLLRRYIDALTLKPANPLEVIHAVAHDLTEIALNYDGSFPKACGQQPVSERTRESEQKRALERAKQSGV